MSFGRAERLFLVFCVVSLTAELAPLSASPSVPSPLFRSPSISALHCHEWCSPTLYGPALWSPEVVDVLASSDSGEDPGTNLDEESAFRENKDLEELDDERPAGDEVERDEDEADDNERDEDERGEDEDDEEENEDEYEELFREIRHELRDTIRERKEIDRKSKQLDDRIKRLERIVEAVDKIQKVESQIENLDEGSSRFEELIERLEQLAIELRLGFRAHECINLSVEFDELRESLEEDGTNKERAAFQKLLDIQTRRLAIITELDRQSSKGELDEFEEAFEEFEELSERLEPRFVLFHLERKLRFARNDGRSDEVEELAEELKHLRREFGVEGEEEKKERIELANSPMARPVEVTSDEVRQFARLSFEADVVPRLKAVCSECHDSQSASGDLDLNRLISERPLVVNRTHWLNVIQQLKVRSMPPTDAAQPDEADRKLMVGWLTNAIENFDYETVRSPGFEPARRLTRDEYNNTVRDLFGIDLRPADSFPTDLTASSGFENSANSLFIQSTMMERYVGAAEAIVTRAIPDTPTTPELRAAEKNLFADANGMTNENAVRSVLNRFAERAFRRPVSAEELDRLIGYYSSRRAEGQKFKPAIRDVIQVMLVSPSFLIRTEERPDGPGPQQVNDWELASRLSYFLWASMPDDELFELAKAKRLSDPEVLEAQVARMLSDPRADSLGDLFAAQWLGFKNLPRVQRDQIDNPWATDSLVDAMHAESAMFFTSIIRSNAPVERLIDARYTFLNEELAGHYRIRGVRGAKMQRVELDGPERGGLLGHASILAITSFPGRTSPVLRGNWILSELLGTPPPPPPPNVSQLNERIAENDRLSQRQKLELHRRNPNCYACHSQIDPLGFGLQEYDWFGRHRQRRRDDSIGELPGGLRFEGAAGLRQVLVEHRVDDLSSQLTRKMLAYALGRQLEYYDEATVLELRRALDKDGRRVQSLIRAIVLSDAFQKKQVLEDRRQASKPEHPVRSSSQ